jgi:phosphopantothenoylcysteine decarboxylase/phosphopantothenate--cysteine ligase
MADRGVKRKSERLAEREIALAVCGGIGAVESVKLIRELRRHGASVTAYFTPTTTQFISAMSVEWAAEKKVIQQAGAEVDHLGGYDLVLVAPATLNTIAKSALGLTDNAVTLLTASQLGRRAPLVFVPTMNEQLQSHPLYPEYRQRLESWGAHFFSAPVEEGRYKMPAPEAVVHAVMEVLP